MSITYHGSKCWECLYMDLEDRDKYDNKCAYCFEFRKYFPTDDNACSTRFEYDETEHYTRSRKK